MLFPLLKHGSDLPNGPQNRPARPLFGSCPCLQSSNPHISQSSYNPAKQSVKYLRDTLDFAPHPNLNFILLVEVLPNLQSPSQIPRVFIQNSSPSKLFPLCTLLISFIILIKILLVLWSLVPFCSYIETWFLNSPIMSSSINFMECFSNISLYHSHLRVVKTGCGTSYCVSDSVYLGWGLRVPISNKFTGDAAASAAMGTTLWEPLLFSFSPASCLNDSQQGNKVPPCFL